MSSVDLKWVELNVGGQIFLTTKQTLMSCPGSILAKMFDPESGFEAPYSRNGVFFIDADPNHFGIILNWLRYQKIIADSDTNMINVAKVANYFGIVELVEKINLTGKWVEPGYWPLHYAVAAMKMDIKKNDPYPVVQVAARIAQFPNGLKVVKEDQVEKWGGKCLVLDVKKPCVWVPTVSGKVPTGAIAVHVDGGENKFIGRKFYYMDGSSQEEISPSLWNGFSKFVVPDTITKKGTDDEDDYSTYISVGYVNEMGIFGVTFAREVSAILIAKSSSVLTIENHPCSISEFEILCAF